VTAPAAIEVLGVSKRFRIYREKPTSLKQRLLSRRTRSEDFWALRDVDVEVPDDVPTLRREVPRQARGPRGLRRLGATGIGGGPLADGGTLRGCRRRDRRH